MFRILENDPLVMAIVSELIDGIEDYFRLNDNLLISLALNDILKVLTAYINLNTNARTKQEITNQYKLIIEAKLHFVPLLDVILTKLSNITCSDEHILNYIHRFDVENINRLGKISLTILKIFEIIEGLDISNKSINISMNPVMSKFKFCDILFTLISRFFELAGSEVSRSFKIYRKVSRHLSVRHEMIGGVVYFLFVVCFEIFAPGLNEFLRISLKDLDALVHLDPTLSYWIPELSLIRSILALYSHRDQKSIDCLIQLTNFEIHNIKPEFSYILKSSFNVPALDEQIIALKLIEKFGNTNIGPIFLKSFRILNNSFEKKYDNLRVLISSNTQIIARVHQNVSLDLNDPALEWISDFICHLEHNSKIKLFN